MVTRRELIAGGAALLTPGFSFAQGADTEVADAMWKMVRGSRRGFDEGMAVIEALDDVALVPPLILVQRFSRAPSAWLDAPMQRLTGEDRAGWYEWMLWQEANAQVVPPPWYADLKRRMYLQIDPNFEVFLRDEYLGREAARIRFEEVTWGGVRKDGIPSLDNPRLIAGKEAAYLREEDLVFGVSINGDARAYPL
ncbi:MAG: DUF3179 domain-containing (seleno)protein, partial [Pseudomonadota bacterium]